MKKGKGAVAQLQVRINKGIKDGTFVKLTQDEIDKLEVTPHHFPFHSAVVAKTVLQQKYY